MPLFPPSISTVIQMAPVDNSVSVTGQVWWDGTHIWMNIAGTNYRLDHPATSAYTISGVVANRIFNAATATSLVTAQALGTLLTDLQTSGYIS